jgi:magnesium chelatase subunit I
LKDRIGSVIRTHYPLTRDDGIAITDANAWIDRDGPRVLVPRFMKDIVEEIARLARISPAINQQSGVSVRLSIASMEVLVSNAERRGLLTGEDPVVPRISDLAYSTAAARGKIELALAEEDGQEERVYAKLLGEAVKNVFDGLREIKQLRPLVEWFEAGKTFATGDRVPSAQVVKKLSEFAALDKEITRLLERPELSDVSQACPEGLRASLAEFVLEALHVHNRVNKTAKGQETTFKR